MPGKNGEITKEAIDHLAIKQIESKIFDLTDYLGTKRIGQATQELHNLIQNKEPIPRLLILLYNHFKKLYFVKLAVEEKKNIAQSLNLRANQLFLVSKYQKQAGYFEKEDIRTILDEFCNLDANSKIGLIDMQIGLEAVLCCYCK